jgi:hypothetical protein
MSQVFQYPWSKLQIPLQKFPSAPAQGIDPNNLDTSRDKAARHP